MNAGIEFEGRTVLITGGAGGIALATARRLLTLGARIFLTDRDAEGLERARRELGGGESVAVGCADITASEQVDEVVRRCANDFGALYALINSAGVFPEVGVADMTDREWRQVHAINLDGTFYACRAAAPLMADGGSIVNITSIAAHRGSTRHAHYASSKAGVLGFSRSFAQEMAPRVRVNCVSPGPVDTPMIRQLWDAAAQKILASTPLRRICTPEEVATAVVFLASDWASFITAETLHVNGGHYIYG
jgi:3-oxoacyl-[acyl-carrier protein] reductase